MIDVDSLNDYIANIGKSLASASNCSHLEKNDVTHVYRQNYFSLSNSCKLNL